MNKTSPKERILETASRLFYTQGYNNTGINQILEEANVARASLYQHFGSKDELGVHYLKAGREEWFAGLEKWTDGKKTPAQKLTACFDFLEYALRKNSFLGCRFINMLTEIGSTSPLMSKEILEHKAKLRNFFKHLTAGALENHPQKDKDLLGDSIYLLFEGAIIESKIYKDAWPIKRARMMAKLIVEDME